MSRNLLEYVSCSRSDILNMFFSHIPAPSVFTSSSYLRLGSKALMLEAFVEWENRFPFMNMKMRLRHFPWKRNSANERSKFLFVCLGAFGMFLQTTFLWISVLCLHKSLWFYTADISGYLYGVWFNFLTRACLFIAADFGFVLLNIKTINCSQIPSPFAFFLAIIVWKSNLSSCGGI